MSRILRSKFIDGNGSTYAPSVVRLGASIDATAKKSATEGDLCADVSIDRQVAIFLNVGRAKLHEFIVHLDHQLYATKMSINCLRQSMRCAVNRADTRNRDLTTLADLITKLERDSIEREKCHIALSMYGERGLRKVDLFPLENIFIQSAELVFTTLSSASRNVLTRSDYPFATLLIDEAAQACEVSCLQALQYNPRHVVLVGDPQQLPATVISRRASQLQFGRSLFERLQDYGCGSIRLTMQYRMHPEIREFPSKQFYDNSLVDAAAVSARMPEVFHEDPYLKPFLFYDVIGKEVRSAMGSGTSISNEREATFVLALIRRLYQTLSSSAPEDHVKPSVAVVTPYRDQVRTVRSVLARCDLIAPGTIRVGTVDGFQGQEADIVIISCVRSSMGENYGKQTSTGFVADVRRMNVAITRAKRSLWIIGDSSALQTSDDWKKLIEHAKWKNNFWASDLSENDILVQTGQPQD